MTISLEIAVQDPEGITTAARAGADRIELCTALALGGTTPSHALIAAAVAERVLPVHVLIRPRPGGFDYTPAEHAVILDDVRHALDVGAAGVVVGGTCNGEVDTWLVSRVRQLAQHADVTFHRAFDTLADRPAALAQLADLGVDRVLTSGGAAHVRDALDEIERLVALADGRIQVMAGAGIDATTVGAVAVTGVAAIHASAKRSIAEPHLVDLGSLARAGTITREVTDEARVRALRAALDALEGAR